MLFFVPMPHRWRKFCTVPNLTIGPFDPVKKRRAAGIVWEALREIGILLIAFSPLDMALNSDGKVLRWTAMCLFLVAGLIMFIGGIIGEWRLGNADKSHSLP